jgi:3-dehydro-4-phosphotetronate decarboxylase
MTEASLRAEMVRWGASLFGRGLTPGSSGNISVRLEEGYLVTPTNVSIGWRMGACFRGTRHRSRQ